MKFLTQKQVKLPKRVSTSHKRQNGTVLIVGGSEEYVGAPLLAGLAALRSGCDIVVVAAPEKVAWHINAYTPDLITMKLRGRYLKPSHLTPLKHFFHATDAFLLGNGSGIRKETQDLHKKIASSTSKLKVVDADALKALSMKGIKNTIITPHEKELEIFLANSHAPKKIIQAIRKEKKVEKKANLIKKAAQSFLDHHNVILLKGKVDAIISHDAIFYNRTGNAGMTKGGTGDVLAGLCVGFLAQSRNVVQSAVNAAFINGQIGDILLKKKKGFTYLASDMVEELRKIRYPS